MAKVDYIYTDGLEAIYINNKLEVYDELIDIETVLDLLLGKEVSETYKWKMNNDIFEFFYGLEFPKDISSISNQHLSKSEYRIDNSLN